MPTTLTTLMPDGSLETTTEPDQTAASPAHGAGVTMAEPAPAPEPDEEAAPSPEEERSAAPAPAEPSDDDTETGPEEEAPASAARRQPSSVDRAMARLRRESAEARERAAAAEERARLLEAGYARPPADTTPEAPARERLSAPQQNDYASDPEWYADLAKWEARQAVEAFKREQMEGYARQAQAQREQALEARQEAFRRQHPDYDQVLSDQLSGRMTPQLFAHLVEDDDGPALAYHVLARDPEQLERLNAMDERSLARALGRLAARLPTNGAPSSSSPVIPKPSPPTPLSGTGAGAPTGYHEGMSQAEFDRLFPYRPGRR